MSDVTLSNHERETGKVRVRIVQLRLVRDGRGVVAHIEPAEGEEATRCCGVSVLDLPDGTSRLVEFPSQATCTAGQDGEDRGPEWWDR